LIRFEEKGPPRHRLANLDGNGQIEFLTGPSIKVKGTEESIRIDDVISVEGPRQPSFGEAPTVLRVGYILLQRGGTSTNTAAAALIERIRQNFDLFFQQNSQGRLSLDSTLAGAKVSFHRGDTNADGLSNLTDPVFLLNYLFQSGAVPPC